MKENTNSKIIACGRTLCGNVDVVSSKSELHRLIFCACLADRPCGIYYNSRLSNDILATVSVFRSLGAEIEICDKLIKIEKPLDTSKKCEKTELFCSESGSTARFLVPLASLLCEKGTVITGAGKLPERPFSDLCRCLCAHSAGFSDEKLPMGIVKNTEPCEGAVFEISGDISSQYLSGLLFILPLCKNAKIKLTTPLKSKGYVDMTADAMKKFGVTVTECDGVYEVFGKYTCKNEEYHAFGDWSNAAFFLCGAKDRHVTVTGIDTESAQPDIKILEILSSCGFEVKKGADFVTVKRCENLLPIVFDASENPDLVPIVSVLAATIPGESVISGISRLRFKESDRVKSVCEMIQNLGGNISEKNDSLYIIGKKRLSGGTVCGFCDHRIVMSASIASSFCENDVTVTDAFAASKSYPAFFEDLSSLTEEKE